ncbi:MAG TPA: type II toxin-antitoxin system HipA family toxin [Povalibacter sp.]|uniref:type II toxin-antitoxin system HipA family toxin n=1 Tax=Povalibacter sp. TaxID=1962978 RepID=UPI002C7E2A5D|nr:type II toxin-antitoxin system HipA family toxin [Povalibacter sp.]HMN46909.1 type II toxin-antitoxin system HipA family toxin [Povalibacter sp.]
MFTAGRAAGSLVRSDVAADSFLFGYRTETPPENAVSLTMPVRADQYDSMAGLLPLFEMNLPEGALGERLRLQFAKTIPEFDDLDLLQIVGASQIGRLRYSLQDSIDENVPVQDLAEILTYKGGADLFADLLERFATYSGISGMQPKVLIREIPTPGKITHRGATHIVKSFDAREYPELAANEFICTQGAAAAGIDTPRVQLSENRQFLIVERFDLLADGAYLGLEDFCVLDGRRSHGRYDGSYEGIARRMADYVSPTVLGRAKDQFALMVAYSCAVGNGDAHMKNFSVIYRHPEDEVTLAPAYDVVSTLPYMPRDTLALELSGSKEFPDRARLLKFVRQVTGKNSRAAQRLLDQAAAGIDVALQHAADYGRQHDDAAEFVERISAVMTAGRDRLTA